MTEGLVASGLGQVLNDPSRMPAQGVGDTDRIGDHIRVTGFRLRMLIGQKSDRPNVNFRWVCVAAPKGSSYNYNDWFISTTNNVLLDDVNTDYLKILKTGIWRPNEAGLVSTGTKEYTFTKKIIITFTRD